jgi:hypothetical protein
VDEWRVIPSFPDYEASSGGHIRSYKQLRPRILSGWIGGGGYRQVKISDEWNGGKRTITVHSLVCEAFHGPKPSPKHEVRHLDGDRLHNAASNLRWGTASENRHDSVRHGTHYFSRKAA